MQNTERQTLYRKTGVADTVAIPVTPAFQTKNMSVFQSAPIKKVTLLLYHTFAQKSRANFYTFNKFTTKNISVKFSY